MSLEEIVGEFEGLPREDRIALLMEYAAKLPAVPESLRADARRWRRVDGCRTPTRIAVEPDGDGVRLWVEVEGPAPVVEAVAAVLVELCEGATREEILSIPRDLPVRIVGPEMLGQRRHGLSAMVQQVKSAVSELPVPPARTGGS